LRALQPTAAPVRQLSRSRGPVRPVLRLLRPRDGAGRRAPVVVAAMVPRCVGSAGGGPHLWNRPGSSPPLVVCPRPFVPEWPHGESQTWPFVPEWPLGESQTRPFVPEWPHFRCGLANALTCSDGGRTPRRSCGGPGCGARTTGTPGGAADPPAAIARFPAGTRCRLPVPASSGALRCRALPGHGPQA